MGLYKCCQMDMFSSFVDVYFHGSMIRYMKVELDMRQEELIDLV